MFVSLAGRVTTGGRYKAILSRQRAFFGVPVDSQKENGGAAAHWFSRIKAGSKKSAQHRPADLSLDKVAACRRVTIGPQRTRASNKEPEGGFETADSMKNDHGLVWMAAAAESAIGNVRWE